jgi:hypothetical protein
LGILHLSLFLDWLYEWEPVFLFVSQCSSWFQKSTSSGISTSHMWFVKIPVIDSVPSRLRICCSRWCLYIKRVIISYCIFVFPKNREFNAILIFWLHLHLHPLVFLFVIMIYRNIKCDHVPCFPAFRLCCYFVLDFSRRHKRPLHP